MASQWGMTARMLPLVTAVWPASGSRAAASATMARMARCSSRITGSVLVVTFGCGL